MASVKLSLDTRRKLNDDTCPVKLVISHNSKTANISLSIHVCEDEWDSNVCQVIGKNAKKFNMVLNSRLSIAQRALYAIQDSHEISSISVSQLKDRIQASLFGVEDDYMLLTSYIDKVMQSKISKTRKQTFKSLKVKIEAFDSDIQLSKVDKHWCKSFLSYMQTLNLKTNSINLMFTALKNVFNTALDDEIISVYPMRGINVSKEETPMRNLTIDKLVYLRDVDLSNCFMAFARDMFMLSFYLIGCNTTDIYNLQAIDGDRIKYRRSKTSRLFNIKVEPEAMEIIEKHKGVKGLTSLSDYASRDSATLSLNRYLKMLLPNLTMYWARYTWATIAHEIDIPKDIISLALGHSFGVSVTDTYIQYDYKKVDLANRKVIDYVNSYKK